MLLALIIALGLSMALSLLMYWLIVKQVEKNAAEIDILKTRLEYLESSYPFRTDAAKAVKYGYFPATIIKDEKVYTASGVPVIGQPPKEPTHSVVVEVPENDPLLDGCTLQGGVYLKNMPAKVDNTSPVTHKKHRRVQCTTTGRIFKNMSQAARFYKLSSASVIHHSLAGLSSFAGRHPATNAKLQWMYIDDTESKVTLAPKEHATDHKDYRTNAYCKKPIQCMNTGKIFDSSIAAAKYYHISTSALSNHLRGRLKSAGIDPVTNQRLVWKYIQKESK